MARQFHNAGHHHHHPFTGDTTLTKIFVGGLAWETQHDTMRHYFEQFGDILEAVVITDKHTGRSKGYGFVTFRDADSATRACENPTPVIDGRRANCNLASLGAVQRPRQPPPTQYVARYRPGTMVASSSTYRGSAASTAYYHPPSHYPYHYLYGYSQESMYPMSYYGVGGAQHHQFSPYYTSANQSIVSGFYPYYSQASQPQVGLHYPQPAAAAAVVPQYTPYYPQSYLSAGVLPLPTTTGAIGVAPIAAAASSPQPPDYNLSA